MVNQTIHRIIKSVVLNRMFYSNGCTLEDVVNHKILALRTDLDVCDPKEAKNYGEICHGLVTNPHVDEEYNIYYFRIAGFGNTKIFLGKTVTKNGFTDYYMVFNHGIDLVYYQTTSYNKNLDSLYLLVMN